VSPRHRNMHLIVGKNVSNPLFRQVPMMTKYHTVEIITSIVFLVITLCLNLYISKDYLNMFRERNTSIQFQISLSVETYSIKSLMVRVQLKSTHIPQHKHLLALYNIEYMQSHMHSRNLSLTYMQPDEIYQYKLLSFWCLIYEFK